jgi:hypothetical protein
MNLESQNMEIRINTPDFLDLDSVLDWTGFKSADEKHRALVFVSEREEYKLTKELNDYFLSSTLSEMESKVFVIDVHDIPGLYWAYWRYQSFCGQNETYFSDFAEQERLDHAQYYHGLGIFNFHSAVWFMTSVCGLTRSKSMGWIFKDLAAQIRCGIY